MQKGREAGRQEGKAERLENRNSVLQKGRKALLADTWISPREEGANQVNETEVTKMG